jgi:hypothetical protein
MTTAENHLARFHTRLLLKALRRCCVTDHAIRRVHAARAALNEPWMWEWTREHFEKISFCECLGFPISIHNLKQELASRPHIPSKQEAREIRRNKARSRRRGRRDR